MECRKWEEAGLLYSAKELGAQAMRDYEEHLVTCGECRNEIERYRAEQERFFTPGILCEAPSPEVDAEILRVCADPRPKIRMATPVLFPALLRRAFVPVMLFILGFISVGYISMNRENARQMKAVAVQRQTVAPQSAVAQAKADLSKDSLRNREVNFARTRGNLDDQGVITVDLKK
jgi:anti-sigma factor RsiW